MGNMGEEIHCCFLVGKARVTPKTFVSIPLLELVAAVLSVKVPNFLKKKLKIDYFCETYWPDSKAILGYIRNHTKKRKIFLAKTIKQIREHSKVEQWRYASTKINPAYYASRFL